MVDSVMGQPSAVSLYGIQARSAPAAVLFRRGPSKRVLLVRWNTSDDTFEEGQWLKGRIYERRCDLSPDGELLLYFAASYRKPYYSWTAVSRPPFLTALALWPKGDGWGGGGHFSGRRKILLNHRPQEMTLARGFSVPRWMKVEPFGSRAGWGEDDPVWCQRLMRDGWTYGGGGAPVSHARGARFWIAFDPPIVWEKAHPRWPQRYRLQMAVQGLNESEGRWYVVDHAVLDRAGERLMSLGRAEWADWSPAGDLLFTSGARVHRVPSNGEGLTRHVELVANFEDREFVERVAPRPSLQWPRK